jgi:hypothetical protein
MRIATARKRAVSKDLLSQGTGAEICMSYSDGRDWLRPVLRAKQRIWLALNRKARRFMEGRQPAGIKRGLRLSYNEVIQRQGLRMIVSGDLRFRIYKNLTSDKLRHSVEHLQSSEPRRHTSIWGNSSLHMIKLTLPLAVHCLKVRL